MTAIPKMATQIVEVYSIQRPNIWKNACDNTPQTRIGVNKSQQNKVHGMFLKKRASEKD